MVTMKKGNITEIINDKNVRLHLANGWVIIPDVEEEEAPTPPNYDKLTAKQLRELLKENGLAVYGTKAELIKRLHDFKGLAGENEQAVNNDGFNDGLILGG